MTAWNESWEVSGAWSQRPPGLCAGAWTCSMGQRLQMWSLEVKSSLRICLVWQSHRVFILDIMAGGMAPALQLSPLRLVLFLHLHHQGSWVWLPWLGSGEPSKDLKQGSGTASWTSLVSPPGSSERVVFMKSTRKTAQGIFFRTLGCRCQKHNSNPF